MAYQAPPIIKAAERLLVDIEQAVRRFVCYHRYQIGADLRRKAMEVYELVDRAWRERNQQLLWVERLRMAIDTLRRHLQVAKILNATTSFRQFEQLLRQTTDLGRQAGGWWKHLKHSKGQSAQGQQAVAQSAQTLSTCAASAGANP